MGVDVVLLFKRKKTNLAHGNISKPPSWVARVAEEPHRIMGYKELKITYQRHYQLTVDRLRPRARQNVKSEMLVRSRKPPVRQ